MTCVAGDARLARRSRRASPRRNAPRSVRERDAPVLVARRASLPCFCDPALLHLEEVGEVGAELELDRAERGLLAEVARSRCLRACRGRRSGGGRPRGASRRGPPRVVRAARTRALNGSVVVAASGSGALPFSRSRSSDRKRVSRKNRPCGRSGSISPDARRDAERRAFDEGDDAVGRHRGSRSRSSSTAGASRSNASPSPSRVPPDGVAARTLARDADRDHRARCGSPSLRPATAGSSSSSSLLADGLVDAGHDVTLFASGGSTHARPTLVSPLAEPPDPRDARQPVVRRATTRSSSYLQVDGFDVVHDHAGIVGPVLRRDARRTTRRSCTRCTARGPSRARLLYSARCTTTCISSRSATRSAPTTPTCRTRAPCTTASTSRVPVPRATRTTSSSTSGARTPTRARSKRSDRPAGRAARCR